MPIGANHAAVKAYIRRLERRHRFNFSACEIALCNAIALVQKLHGIQLDALFRLFVRIGNAAHHNVQLFPFQAFAQGALVLVCTEMRQKVCHAEHRVSRRFAHAEFHLFAAALVHHPMQGKRRGAPLIFADTTIIVGFKQ